MLAVDTVLISVVLVVGSEVTEGVTEVLVVVSGSGVSLRQEENSILSREIAFSFKVISFSTKHT